jgi:hypothetical protein
MAPDYSADLHSLASRVWTTACHLVFNKAFVTGSVGKIGLSILEEHLTIQYVVYFS